MVLSACSGVTDALLGLVSLAEQQDERFPRRDRARCASAHSQIAEQLLAADVGAPLPGRLRPRLPGPRGDPAHRQAHAQRRARGDRSHRRLRGDLVDAALSISICRARPRVRAPCAGSMRGACVTVEWGSLGPAIAMAASHEQPAPNSWRRTSPERSSSPASSRARRAACRRRSAATAAIFPPRSSAALLDAREIHIWTDVDGVLSADPRRVPDATVIDSLSYNEAMELAYFGAKVIHPQTMAPAVGGAIPIWIRNTFAPEKQGTLICAQPQSALPIKGITSIEHIALVNLEGAGMIGVPGTAQPPVRRAARGGHLGHPHLAGQLRAFDLLRRPAEARPRGRRPWCAPRSSASCRKARSRASMWTLDLAILAVVGDGMAGAAGYRGQSSSMLARFGERQRARDRAGRLRERISPSSSKAARRRARCARCMPGSIFRRTRCRLASSAPAPSAACSSISSPRKASGCTSEFNLDLRIRGILRSRRMMLAATRR